MVERDRARGWIAAWPEGLAAARRHVLRAPAARQFAARLAAVLRRWCVAELSPGRLVPWLPVAFGLGIALYFTAEREPAIWAGASLVLILAAGAVAARNRPIAFPILLALATVAAGFAAATLHTANAAHPILRYPTWNVAISGWVDKREQRARSDRITIQVAHIAAPRLNDASRACAWRCAKGRRRRSEASCS